MYIDPFRRDVPQAAVRLYASIRQHEYSIGIIERVSCFLAVAAPFSFSVVQYWITFMHASHPALT